MNSKQIDEIAVSTVTNYFCYCTMLSPYISSNDKEPCWDGFIYVYGSESQNNESLIGRIPTQVKGRELKREVFKKEISYPVSISNLKTYKQDGGILYLVVYIYLDRKQIYYARLTPIDIKRYIKNAKGKHSTSIKLEQLPNYTIEINHLFLDFYLNCKKQTSTADNPILEIDEVAKNWEGLKLTFFASGLQKQNIQSYLSKQPVYLYAEVSTLPNMKSLLPVGDGPVYLSFTRKISADINVCGITYFKEFKQQIIGENSVITIGDCLTITMPIRIEQKVFNGKIDYVPTATLLSAWIKENEFIYNILTHGELNIDGNVFKMSLQKKDTYKKTIAKDLDFWKKVKCVFEKLHVNAELDLNQIEFEDEECLKILIDAFCFNKKVRIKEKIDQIFNLRIANLDIALSCEQHVSGSYKLATYKKLIGDISYKDNSTTKPLLTCVYSWFQKEGFRRVSNIDYEDILPSYQNIYKKNAQIVSRANCDMLFMLLAYDENQDKKLLKVAKQLCDWFIAISPNEVIYKLNLYQIIKRERELSVQEKQSLLVLLADSDSDFNKIAIYLLLENQEMASLYFNRLSMKDQTAFISFPIYYFWKK